ncbi:MAG: GGDEF domain-containing protein [Candidatus Galacturonibacter soehngenii]|nr:GGDEF domain-containing protein [Candidatus Galacturonibacter soehngenii]
MENSKSLNAGGIWSDKLKVFFYHFMNKSDLEQQELNEYLIRDNISHMLIVSLILMLISVVKIVFKIKRSWFADIGITMLFITLLYIMLWYFTHCNLIQSLKAQKVIYITFWLFINVVGLKELYSEIQVYQSITYYYLLMFLLTGFYIGSFLTIIFFIGFDTIVTIVMLTTIPRIEMNLKLYIAVTIMIALVSFIIMMSRFYHYILEKRAQFAIRTLGGVDRLTNLLNRRGFDEKIAQMWGAWSDTRKTIVAIMVDIDCFKNYNDTFGHIAGDQCLKDISECIYDIASRKSELIVRYGGEEIVIVLTNQSEEECIEVALAIQERINSLNIKSGEKATYKNVTVSMGVASMLANPNNTIYDLIEKADEQLYYSKNNGRNAITMNYISVELNKVMAASVEKDLELLSMKKKC